MASRPPPLTSKQKSELSILEPALKDCVKTGNLNKAKSIASKIQKLLRPTGHETRLLQAKNWLYETAMEINNLTYAKMGFEGTRKLSSINTRVYLEATSLLGICYIREQNIEKARPLIQEAVDKINNIKSNTRRRQFHKRLLVRLEEESILSGLMTKDEVKLNIDEVDNEAIKLVMTKTEDQILIDLGSSLPSKSIDILENIRSTYQQRLPGPDRKFLPAPLTKERKLDLGNRAGAAIKRVAWRALCNAESEIYKAWSQGLSVVYDKKYIAAAIVASFKSFNISIIMIAASAAALAIKFGVEVFCEMFAPKSLMIDRSDKS